MPVKRRPSEELADVPGPNDLTAPPPTFATAEEYTPWSKSKTDVPSEQSDYDEDRDASGTRLGIIDGRRPFGRTWPDFVFAFFNHPLFIPIVSIIVSFIIFSRQLQTIGDMWRPSILIGIINVTWFGGNRIVKLSSRHRQHKTKSRL